MNLTRHLHDITPLRNVNGRAYKRDDLLAFDNGVNGKVRTSIYLAEWAEKEGTTGLVYGGSVHAPALGRVASAAAYAEIQCTLVIGSSLDTALRHPTVRVAYEAGARFERAKVAYNPALQKMAAEVAHATGAFQVPYGVSTPEDWSSAGVRQFLEQDADQVKSLKEQEIKTLVIPFGSGNAATGILYGLHKWDLSPAVKLVGVGPDKTEWLKNRLNYVGLDYDDFNIEHLPLHPWFAEYSDRMPETMDGIDFHPTYEGKVVRYLNQLKPEWWTRRDSTTCFWIVGGPLP